MKRALLIGLLVVAAAACAQAQEMNVIRWGGQVDEFNLSEIDSITFRFEKGNSFFPDSYFGQLYARDFTGPGDTYWIKTWKNGTFLNKPNEINIAYDAGFSAG